MRFFLFQILLFLFFQSIMLGQDGHLEFSKKEKFVAPFKNELGANINFFLDHWILKGDEESNLVLAPDHYILATYKRFFGKTALRIGVGGLRKDIVDTTNVNMLIENKHRFYNLHLGCQRNMRFGDQWEIYGGGDILLQWNLKTENYLFGVPLSLTSDFSFHEDNRFIGCRPFFGFQFFITPIISLSSEVSFQATKEWRRRYGEEISIFFPVGDPLDENSESTNWNFQAPVVLYVNFRFGKTKTKK